MFLSRLDSIILLIIDNIVGGRSFVKANKGSFHPCVDPLQVVYWLTVHLHSESSWGIVGISRHQTRNFPIPRVNSKIKQIININCHLGFGIFFVGIVLIAGLIIKTRKLNNEWNPQRGQTGFGLLCLWDVE